MKYTANINTVIEILKDEASGDVKSALKKMSKDYKMTWVYQSKDELFPSTGENIHDELEDVYPIKGRSYDIRNIAEGEDVVIIEVIESYPDPKTGEIYRTPQVIVLEFKDGLIRTGRHYTDPRLSYMDLSIEKINSALRDTKTKILIEDKR
jgi:ketosteroid isomerase-like protein